MKRLLVLLLLVIGPFLSITHAVAATQTPLTRQSNQESDFRHGRTIHFPNGLVVTLSIYEPVKGLTQVPGGPPLRPRNGKRFVITSWYIRNTTHHIVKLVTWMARSSGINSTAFFLGNAGNAGIIFPRETVNESWYFEVAKVGRVAIFYDHFPDHWLPRG